MEDLKATLSSWKAKVGGVLVALLSLLYFWNRLKTAESKVLNAEFEKTDAVLAERGAHIKAEIEHEKVRAEREKQETDTPAEIVDRLRNL